MAGDQIRRDFATLETRRGKTSEGPWFFAPSLRAALNASRKEDLMSRTNVRFALRLLLICSTAAVVPASAQHFEQIDSEGPQLSYVAAGRSEVWGLHFPGGEIYRLNPSTKKFLKVNGSLSQVAAGGGSLLEPDVVWGVNGAGVFSFSCTNASGKSCSYTPHNPPARPTSSKSQSVKATRTPLPEEAMVVIPMKSGGSPRAHLVLRDFLIDITTARVGSTKSHSRSTRRRLSHISRPVGAIPGRSMQMLTSGTTTNTTTCGSRLQRAATTAPCNRSQWE